MSIKGSGDPSCREMSIKRGKVLRISAERKGITEAVVSIGEDKANTVAYSLFGGRIQTGDEVLLNTTGVDLKLGSGGYHFVLANLSRPQESSITGPGHIMKLRYTPLQFKSHSLEESFKPSLKADQEGDLAGMTVVVLELHSMLLPAAYAIKRERPHVHLAYIMTDGGSLPLVLSKQVAFMRESGLIDATITAGHAFGGDLEAVNMYTALQGAGKILKAGVCIVAMGPGVLGTGTPFGFSGIEQGENINRVHVLKGKAITCLRMSFADPRSRHRGVSHHSLTSLSRAALAPAEIALPAELKGEECKRVMAQLDAAGLPGMHTLVWQPVGEVMEELKKLSWPLSSMGRGLDEDPYFFAAAAAAGKAALAYLA